MPDYSYPSWMTPQGSPWQALVSGVQAGAQIAANRQRGRALAAQIDHQQFEETVLRQKADADAQDLKTLQEWWPTFSQAEGEALQTLQVPPLKNANMWNRLNIAVGEKRQQAAASELANSAATLDFTDPVDIASWYRLGGQAMKSGLKIDIKDLQAPVFKAQELKRLENSAEALAAYREGRLDLGYATLEERAEHNRISEEMRFARDQATIDRLNAEKEAVEARISLRQGELDERRRRTDFLISQAGGKLPPAVKSDLDYAKLKYDERGFSKDKIKNIEMYQAERERLLAPYRSAESAAPAKKLYFNPETGQLQEQPYAPKR